jgi:hypothetical protein
MSTFQIATLPILVLTLFSISHAFVITPRANVARPTPTLKDDGIKAIVPTSAGQIGINPVISDLGDPDTYIGEIFGTDTQYITLDPPEMTTKVS